MTSCCGWIISDLLWAQVTSIFGVFSPSLRTPFNLQLNIWTFSTFSLDATFLRWKHFCTVVRQTDERSPKKVLRNRKQTARLILLPLELLFYLQVLHFSQPPTSEFAPTLFYSHVFWMKCPGGCNQIRTGSLWRVFFSWNKGSGAALVKWKYSLSVPLFHIRVSC